MDMIATTFDIAMFLSRGGDCVRGYRALAAKEYDANQLCAHCTRERYPPDRPPNWRRVSGERPSKARERVPCTRMLAGTSRPVVRCHRVLPAGSKRQPSSGCIGAIVRWGY